MLPPVGSSLAPKPPHSRSRPSLFVFGRRPNFLDGAGEVPDGHVSTPDQDSRVAHKTQRRKAGSSSNSNVESRREDASSYRLWYSCRVKQIGIEPASMSGCCFDSTVALRCRVGARRTDRGADGLALPEAAAREKEAGDYKRNELPPDYLPATSLLPPSSAGETR
ncbi:hypothetical protein E4U43_001660 [Claviceps pusilla]|uniref:Uncharacterized protein n=1 Tax=Claviceps pusilla TaxID=123648 RepID=A0A9P7SYY2_9HYPO|nr:hypothetical protein E4U43_001660 [Claviceps pusilla]